MAAVEPLHQRPVPIIKHVVSDEHLQKKYFLSQCPIYEKKRLESFHAFFHHLFGGAHINEAALKDLNEKAKSENRPLLIADLGTGTAEWPLEISQGLAKENILAEIHGYDLISGKYPAERPKNVDLRIWDVNDEPKEEWKGKYDYVHLRLFIASLPIKQIPVVLQHVKSLLRPGGYMDWVDGCSGRLKVTPGNPWTEMAKHGFINMLSVTGKDPFFTDHLADHIKKAGFTLLSKEDYEDHDDHPQHIKECHSSCLNEPSYTVIKNALNSDNEKLRNAMPVKSHEELKQLKEGSRKEIKDGCHYQLPISRFMAQKPV